MHIRSAIGWIPIVVAMTWALTASAASPPRNMVFGEPVFDSGWQAHPGKSLLIRHNLGGAAEDYVIDLHLKDIDNGTGIHNRGIGIDEPRGAPIRRIEEQVVEVVRASGDVRCGFVRLRIWQIPRLLWDSGWQSIFPGKAITLNH